MFNFRIKKSLKIESKKKRKRIDWRKNLRKRNWEMKKPLRRTKVVIRHLPPSVTQSFLFSQIDDRFSDRYNWFSFRLGKSRLGFLTFIPPISNIPFICFISIFGIISVLFSKLVPQQSNGAKFVIALLNFLFMRLKIDIW